jgi:hypothetical protein
MFLVLVFALQFSLEILLRWNRRLQNRPHKDFHSYHHRRRH